MSGTNGHPPSDWDRVFTELEPRVLEYVERSLGPRARRWTDPRDVVQKAIAEVWSALREHEGDVDPEEVLRRVCRTAQSRIRDLVRNHARLDGESVLGEAGLDGPGHPPSVGPVTRADERAWLEELVQRLPPDYADVVRCCALEGLTFVETARRLGLEADAVRKRYHTAREALARKLDGRRR